jgi:putative tryptophan/tyrosine transport system substrate-binding protein
MRPSLPSCRRRFLRGSLALIGAGLMAGCGYLPFPAPEPRRLPRVGLLQFGTTASSAALLAAFVQGLRELGYVEGQTVAIDQRVAEGRLEQMPDLAAELLSLDPDVLVVANMEAIQAVRDVSSTVPIVFPAFQDPVENRLGASLARPGGNITGLAITAGLEAAKRLELLKEAVPSLSRVAILWDRPSARRHGETVAAAQALGVGALSLELQDSVDPEAALAPAMAGGIDGLIVMGSFRFSALTPQIVDIAARERLPAMYSIITAVGRGGLLAYAPSILDNFRRSAAYVDKILKGARPSDLPIELPTVFHFVINLKTAQSLGLVIPPSVLQQATEVIQ